VGCGELVCNEKEKECHINEVLIRSGDYLSIDGHQGSIYQGLMKVKEN
jgi:pyruvate,orthophosphate dikinase